VEPEDAVPESECEVGDACDLSSVGFSVRLRAYAIDHMLIVIVSQLLSIPLFYLIYKAGVPESGATGRTGLLFCSLGFVLIAWLYYSIMESSRYQATLGKLFLGLVVVGADGERVSFRRASARFWTVALFYLPLLVFLADTNVLSVLAWFGVKFIFAIFIDISKEQRALNDTLCSCWVFRRSPSVARLRTCSPVLAGLFVGAITWLFFLLQLIGSGDFQERMPFAQRVVAAGSAALILALPICVIVALVRYFGRQSGRKAVDLP
jgi:uncharacterized RDD family membrane protein YckC